MDSNFSSLIKTVGLQLSQTIIINTITDKFMPNITKLFKYLNCFGLMKILTYLLCVSVLLYIAYKLYVVIKKLMCSRGKSLKNLLNKKSKNIIKNNSKSKTNKSTELSSFESRSSDFDLEPKKNRLLVQKSSSIEKKNNKFLIKNLIKSESLLSSSF